MKETFTYIRKHQMIQKGDRIIAGVSGGADSICLLLILLEYQKKEEFAVKVVHIEHGVRGQDSLDDAYFVEKFCKERGVEFECFHRDVPAIAKERKLTVEEAGRLIRYQIFAECKEKWNGNKIAVAHNQNDQAETMIWNMVRGSGLKGSAGISPVRGEIIRPLLSCSREKIECWLRKQNISWREDATNQEEEYTRNLIRRQILPLMEKKLNGKAVGHLFSLSEELQETQRYLEGQTQMFFDRCVQKDNEEIRITIPEFLDAEELLQGRVIRRCIELSGCGLKDITRERIQKIQKLTKMESGKWIELPGGWGVEREFQELVIRRKNSRAAEETWEEIKLKPQGITDIPGAQIESRIFPYENQQIPQKRYTKWLDYGIIKDSLVIRTRKSGDYLVVNSQGARKKLKTYFIEEKIPVSQRDSLPLLCCGKEVLWVIGHRISETGKISPGTREVLEISYRED